MGESMKMIRGNDESRAGGKQCPWRGAGHLIQGRKEESKIAVIG